MTAWGRRLATGGRIDRSRTVAFVWDGEELLGHPGDTLASALLANGRRTVARSLYLDRPRGILAAGADEPNAVVELEDAPAEPMVRATQVELRDGLRARPSNGRGSLRHEPDTARYDHRHVHCDVLVVGAGPAGLAAAVAAGRSGARVVLLDDQPEPGGDLLGSRGTLDGAPALGWVGAATAELRSLPQVRLLTRTTAVGYYDHNYVVAMERRTDHLADVPAHVSRQRLWHVRAGRVVLATGAHERPLVFVDNDLPGVMLASAARTYVNRFAVAPGRRAVVATTGDSAYADARDLLDAGISVAAIVDARRDPGPVADDLRSRGIEVITGAVVRSALGDGAVAGVTVEHVDRSGDGAGLRTLEADLIAVSGGWNPAIHLFSQSRGELRFDDDALCYRPARLVQPQACVGAANGTFGLSDGIAEGSAAGAAAAAALGFAGVAPPPVPDDRTTTPPTAPAACWLVDVHDGDEKGRQFLDLQRDATVADLERATAVGLTSVEHVKRYTTIGTANDQGRTSGVVTNGVLSVLLGKPVGGVGTTTYRPPYVPVPFALLAGRERGPLLDPVRTTPVHAWHVAHGAVFEDVGQWKRPRYYPRDGEDMDAAVDRETTAARTAVAAIDVSTLGKIVVEGPDAPRFLDRIYTNAFATLPVGSARYGMMCTADGMVFDDGVSARLAPDRYLMTTTTGGAARVLDWLEEWSQTEWPDLDVFCTSVTEQWSTTAVVGPRSRELLAAIAPDLDLSPAAFPLMTFRETEIGGVPARVFRISFSGELAYEINVPAWYGLALWEAVMHAGEPHGITPYGTESMHVLRAEKGYVIVGQDTDGTVTPLDLGMGWIVSKTKDFVGKRSLRRVDTRRDDRKQLVGFVTVDPSQFVPEGAQLVVDAEASGVVPMEGHVTSSYRSATLGRSFGLALVRGGTRRSGERLHARSLDATVAVELTSPVFYDPEGTRRDG